MPSLLSDYGRDDILSGGIPPGRRTKSLTAPVTNAGALLATGITRRRSVQENAVDCWIGIVTEGDRRIVRLAGRLSAAQVPELLTTCATGGALELDLSDLVSADPAGIEALQRVRAQGATLVGTPGYIQLQARLPGRRADRRPAVAGSAVAGPALSSRCRWTAVREPRAGLGTGDTELLHAEPQRVRMDAETFGGVSRPVDPPAALLQHGLDVHALHVVERVGRPPAASRPIG